MKKYIAYTVLAFIMLLPFELQATETIICDYRTYSDENGNHKVKDKFILTFVTDKEKDTAYIIGNQGSDKVKLIHSLGGFTFIEITPAGNVMTTTVDTKASSVHSRNTVISGKLLPTQYYGSCEFK